MFCQSGISNPVSITGWVLYRIGTFERNRPLSILARSDPTEFFNRILLSGSLTYTTFGIIPCIYPRVTASWESVAFASPFNCFPYIFMEFDEILKILFPESYSLI